MLAEKVPNEIPDGQWMTPDLLGGDVTNPQSLNRYAYVLNNPASLTDPLGLQSGDFDPRACQDPAYADGHAECEGPGSDFCSQFPYSPECSGYPGGGRGTGGVGGGSAPAPPGPPPAGQPPLAGMGNTMFGGLITCTYAQVTIGGIRYPHGPTACILAGLGISGALGYLLSRPWVFSWTVPLLGEPGVAGVGPSGAFYWNPATRNFCGSLGVGLAGGHTGTIGPVTNAWTLQGVPATPSQIDNIFKGLSWSFGVNSPSPGSSIGPGVQVSGNGAGTLINTNVGNMGAGISDTYGFCIQ